MYKRIGTLDTYLIMLTVPSEDSMFSEEYKVLISSSKILSDLKDLVEGKRERCYFAHGMTNIDFYKVGDKYALTDSPDDGYNTQLIFKDGEFERIIRNLEYVKKSEEHN